VSQTPEDSHAIEPLIEAELTEREVQTQAPDWYQNWRNRIHQWVRNNTDDRLASIITLVPDMLMMVVRLAKDPRVPWMLKGQLVLAAAYVISPLDLVPEGLLGPIGLAEDAGVLALVLFWLKGLSQVDPRVLHDNWPGKGEVDEVIDRIHGQITDNRDRIYSTDVWQKIERRFGRSERTPRTIRVKSPDWLRRRKARQGA
jgi:uncharacterized membrane protein YkvA (DUF1232 family)